MDFSSQEKLIEYLKAHIPRLKLMHILTEELGLRKSAAYNYLNHRVPISYDAMMRLLENPAIAILGGQPSKAPSFTTSWEYQGFKYSQPSPENFVESIHHFIS